MLPQYSQFNQPGFVGGGGYGPEIIGALLAAQQMQGMHAHLGGAGPEIFGAAPLMNLNAVAAAAAQPMLMMNPGILAALRAPIQASPLLRQLPAPAADALALIQAQESINVRQQQEINALYQELGRLQKGIQSRPVLGTDMRVDSGGAVLPRELPVPIDSGPTLIPAGATVNVNIAPQATFRVERLTVADSLGTIFTISDLKVGKDSQFVAAGVFSAELFSNKSVGVGLKGDTAVPGILISVTVTNTSAAAARFLGMIIGFTGLNQ